MPGAGSGTDPSTAKAFKVFGWSGGYIGFAVYPNLPTNPSPSPNYMLAPNNTIVSSYSSDGVHWHKGQTLDTSADQISGLESIHAVIEGPAGLLAVGWSGGCASVYVDGLWTSTDGVSWQPVSTRKWFEGLSSPILHVSGGPAGYVAVGYRGAGAWTSADGRVWQPVALDAAPFVDSKVDDGTAFSGGYVLAGTVGTLDCGAFTGSPPTPPVRSASVWWSVDSVSWTHVPLPGATPATAHQLTWICRLSEDALLVVNDIIGGSRSAWTSIDGRNWTSATIPADVEESQVLTDGHRGLVVQLGHGSATISAFGGDFQLSPLPQSGEVPDVSAAVLKIGFGDQTGFVAFGPTGLMVTDGNQSWIGIPSAN
jgi:hypothetical protein